MERLQLRHAGPGEPMTAIIHDHNPTTYRAATRCCPLATETYRIYRKRLREGRHSPAHLPAIGTARRLQALVANGYTWLWLAGRLHMSTRRVAELAVTSTGLVRRETAAKVRDLYDNHSLTPGPSRYARTVAVRHGFFPPLAWDDDALDDPHGRPYTGDGDASAHVVDREAIRRALAGEKVPLTPLERHQAVHDGLAAGLSRTTLCRLLGMSGHSINSYAGQSLPEYALAA